MSKSCTHCGEDCGRHPIILGDKHFCCNGCQFVYQILEENQLQDYYELEKTPGVRRAIPTSEKEFAYLDSEEIQQKLLSFREKNRSKITLYIPAIHCSSCIWLLENSYQLDKGIIHTLVNFVKKEVSITFDHEQTSLRRIVELFASLNYVPIITLEDTAGTATSKFRNKEERKLLYKLGIAGFCFSNIMLLSLPDYLPGRAYLDANFLQFFSWVNILLGIPVLFYSGWDYISSAYKGLKHGLLNINLPIALGIVTLFLYSSYIILWHGEAGYIDSLAGLVFFLLIGRWYQNKTYEALSFERNYQSYFPVAVTIIKEGKEEIRPLEKLETGMQILVRNKELIPADSILLSNTAQVDYSFVTGESKPIQKNKGDLIFAGGKQIGDAIELLVEKEVKQSYLTQLWNESEGRSEKTGLNSIVDIVSKYFTFFIVAIAIVAAIFWSFYSMEMAIRVFSSILIVACPCALALAIPFTFGNGQRILGRWGFYLKNAMVIEKINKIDQIVFDKTGTLTVNNGAEISFHGTALTNEEQVLVNSLVRHSAHPLSQMLYNRFSQEHKDVSQFQEIAGQGLSGFVDGVSIKMGAPSFTGASQMEHPEQSVVFVSIADQNKGYFSFTNEYRKGIEQVIGELKGVAKLHVLTGDNESEKRNLARHFGENACLLFNQKPEDKLSYVKQLTEAKKCVLMIGDGLNDAGALQESFVGISIAEDVYQFVPACDVIMNAHSFEKLPSLWKFTQKCIRIIYASFVISLLYNLIGLGFAVQGLLLPVIAAILMPLSSVTVALFVTLATNYAARKLKNG